MYFKSLTLLLLLLVVPAHASDAPLAELLPQTVGELHRLQLITGAQAQIEVDKLHGKPLPAEASVIARYARPSSIATGPRPAEVWISRVASEDEARRQTGLMVHKMFDNPRSPFKNPGRIDHGGIPVYRFEGMGQVHLIWYKGDLAFWVSASPGDQAVFLDALCG